MTVRILTPEGRPIRGATLDWWQADLNGDYSIRDYSLRGVVSTDADGVVEVLTTPPAYYGFGTKRAGHFHVIIRPPKDQSGKWDSLTTQLYVCVNNNSKDLTVDL